MTTEVRKVACVGAGLIGSGWATNFIIKGLPVTLYDVGRDRLGRSEELIIGNLRFLNEKNVLSLDGGRKARSLLRFTTDLAEAVRDADLIQESVPEDYGTKREILARIEACGNTQGIFASSTSGLMISEIARDAQNPGRCVGAHPYNPPFLIPLVEISKGEQTGDDVLTAAAGFYRSLGKEPVVLRKEVPGFIGNRLQAALYREVIDLVTRGVCSVEEIDRAVTFGPGLRWGILGPNLLFHLGGGAGGIRGFLANLGPVLSLLYPDLADWKSAPQDWPNIAERGVRAAVAGMPDWIGPSAAAIARFRDDMLIEYLRLHRKI